MVKIEKAEITLGGVSIKYEKDGKVMFRTITAPQLAEQALNVLLDYFIEKKLIDK